MSAPTVIKVENLSKYYRLGVIGGGTLREDLSRWWALKRGRPDPLLKIDEMDHGNRSGGQVWALKDINLEVKSGEILGIIGRNGAGKSTLLKILSRITEPTSGRALIKGRIGSLLEVGTGFHPELTGRENVFLNGSILGMTKAEVAAKLEEIVEFAEISKFIDTPVKRYSSGMVVRLAFAVAAHLDPEIMLIDEVLAVGDAKFQAKCVGKMNEVAATGRTILFVSHNLATISSLCTRGVLLGEGEIKTSGSIETCLAEYSAWLFGHHNSIASHAEFSLHPVKLINFFLNGETRDVIEIAQGPQSLFADIFVEISQACKVAVEATLHGSFGQNIGFYGPSHFDEPTIRLEAGKYKLQARVDLPELLEGHYFLTFRVSDPKFKVHLQLPFCVKLAVRGTISLLGGGIGQCAVNGFLKIHGETSYVEL